MEHESRDGSIRPDAVQPARGADIELSSGVTVEASTAWQRSRAIELVLADVVVVGFSLVVAYFFRFGDVGDTSPLRYGAVAALLLGAWMGMLAYTRVYEPRLLGIGTEEFRRVTSATFQTFGAVAIVSYLLKLEVARGFIAVALPLGFVLLIVIRFVLRLKLQSARREGLNLHRVLAIGDAEGVADLAAQMRLDAHAGFAVVGACLSTTAADTTSAQLEGLHGIAVAGTVDDVVAAARACGADTVAITAGMAIRSDRVRRIAWSLEGSNVDLVIAPAIADVAGPRITMRPVAGLPLIYVDEPQFTGGRRVVKRAVDLVGSVGGLIVLSPLLLITAVLVKVSTKGPAFFRQQRTGKAGGSFTCWKFRSMYVDAESRLASLQQHNEGDGLLFKIRDDPRITPVGRFLRRASIDELPQLFNVLRGDMSLVGPRPLAAADESFEGDVRRRMLVRPGITGLWQVSGRGEQSWEEAIRLDLYYVENWSLSLDVAILLRTLLAVVRGSGAH